ncbi:MAG TPA: hypothetical protein DEP72_00540 [Clostridiales bacterium]|nr:MAG: hypothetical protein A2Y18_03040 [Clostridiales bacterium GWD2_32_19]HCC06639.1 hypothetical protein [Clostridiales bacterium]
MSENIGINSMDDAVLKTEEAEYKGQIVQYMKMDDGGNKIVRVISTDPKVYLKKEFQPGKVIKEQIFENK